MRHSYTLEIKRWDNLEESIYSSFYETEEPSHEELQTHANFLKVVIILIHKTTEDNFTPKIMDKKYFYPKRQP